MNYKVLIVDSNYYENISKNLYKGVENYLREKKIRSNHIKAPGCFEIPYIIKSFDSIRNRMIVRLENHGKTNIIAVEYIKSNK